MINPRQRGFTLIELLVVIAIVAVLAVTVILVLNPSELLKQARDSTRLSDMAALKHAVTLYLTERTLSDSGGYNGVVVASLSAEEMFANPNSCDGVVSRFATAAPGNCSSVLARFLTRIDGNGWLWLNFLSLSAGSPVSALPVDPVNKYNGDRYYAGFYGNDLSANYFEFNARLESTKYAARAANDGGDRPDLYEVGNDPGLDL